MAHFTRSVPHAAARIFQQVHVRDRLPALRRDPLASAVPAKTPSAAQDIRPITKQYSMSFRVTLMVTSFHVSDLRTFASSSYYYSSSIGTTAHCGLWPVEQCPYIFSYLPPTLSIFSLPALQDLFLLPLYIISWVFPFFSSLPVLERRSFWASYPPPFSLGDLTSLSFALLSILLYFLLCSSLLVLDSSDVSIPRFHI